MKLDVLIDDARFNDLRFIAMNLREEDRRELAVTRDPDDYDGLASAAFFSFYRKVAIFDQKARFAFGASQTLIPGVVQVWGFGTPAAEKVLKPVTKYIKQSMVPELLSQGVVEARAFSHSSNAAAHRWLEYLGYTPGATISGAGARKKDSLILFSVSADDLRRTLPASSLAA
jgi:hypothetical protein